MHQAKAWCKIIAMQSVFKFHPIYKERPWGGQAIAGVGTHHHLPPGKKIGESWEISDRPGDESIVQEGEFQGKSIRWLLDEYGEFVMGRPWPKGRRFPLLVKILDCAERLSLQVHPPASVAAALGGEPKTEMWYLLGATEQAALMAGLRKETRRENFENALRSQTLEKLIHRISVRKGDAMFIPSGRIHAIDAGCLILEIQQNSDTTYRVYDWGRVGLDGKLRQLHVQETMRCTNFDDFEPRLIDRAFRSEVRVLVNEEYFSAVSFAVKRPLDLDVGTCCIVHVLDGSMEIASGTPVSGDEVGRPGTKSHMQKGETVLLGAVPHQIRTIGSDGELIVTQCIREK